MPTNRTRRPGRPMAPSWDTDTNHDCPELTGLGEPAAEPAVLVTALVAALVVGAALTVVFAEAEAEAEGGAVAVAVAAGPHVSVCRAPRRASVELAVPWTGSDLVRHAARARPAETGQELQDLPQEAPPGSGRRSVRWLGHVRYGEKQSSDPFTLRLR